MVTRGVTLLFCVAQLTLGLEPFDQAKRLAFRAPSEALAMLPQLNRAADQRAIERLAILRAASIEPATAASEIARWIDAPWLGDILFTDAAAVALHINGEAIARRLMLASAARHPEAALQNWLLIARRAYGLDVMETAALHAPDEAVAILSGTSPYSLELNAAFQNSTNATVRRLLELAKRENLPAHLRQRLAFAELPIETAQDGAAYFHALADMRLRDDPSVESYVLERALANIATEICQTYQQSPLQAPEVALLSAPDLYLLLGYARAGDEDTYFARLFDVLASRGNLADTVLHAHNLHLREFLEYVLWFRRYPQLLRSAGDAGSAQLIRPLVEELNLDNAMTAADAIGFTPEPARLILRQYLRQVDPPGADQMNIKPGLALGLLRRAGQAGPLKSPALASATGGVLQRYFFYDDSDGVDSFASFRAQYAHDAAWQWETRNGWILLRAAGIEIVANVPVDSLSPQNKVTEADRAQRQLAIDEYLGGREPAVIVHRGHAYHVEKTLRYVTRGTRLVYLGSCRGLKDLRSAIEAAPQADIISTRAVGTKRVNDPLLKMLNGAILRSKIVDWPDLWNTLSLRFARDADFASYIPPHRNGAAAFLRLYDAASAAPNGGGATVQK